MSSPRTYPAEQIDENVNMLAAGAHEALQEKAAAEKRVGELEAENRDLREKLAQAPSVELEKVAEQTKFAFETSKLDTVLDQLVEKSIIVPEARQETMEKLASDPAYALDMIQHIANFNVDPLVTPRGRPIETTPKTVKSASAERDEDWFEEPGFDS